MVRPRRNGERSLKISTQYCGQGVLICAPSVAVDTPGLCLMIIKKGCKDEEGSQMEGKGKCG